MLERYWNPPFLRDGKMQHATKHKPWAALQRDKASRNTSQHPPVPWQWASPKDMASRSVDFVSATYPSLWWRTLLASLLREWGGHVQYMFSMTKHSTNPSSQIHNCEVAPLLRRCCGCKSVRVEMSSVIRSSVSYSAGFFYTNCSGDKAFQSLQYWNLASEMNPKITFHEVSIRNVPYLGGVKMGDSQSLGHFLKNSAFSANCSGSMAKSSWLHVRQWRHSSTSRRSKLLLPSMGIPQKQWLLHLLNNALRACGRTKCPEDNFQMFSWLHKMTCLKWLHRGRFCQASHAQRCSKRHGRPATGCHHAMWEPWLRWITAQSCTNLGPVQPLAIKVVLKQHNKDVRKVRGQVAPALLLPVAEWRAWLDP